MFKLLKLGKRLLVFVLSVVAAFLTYQVLITFLLTRYQAGNEFWLIVIPVSLVIWLFTAYFVLPRIHRILVKVYLPDYFIGRARTIDGLLGDPINVAIIGNRQQLIDAMEQAGWVQADPMTLKTSIKILWRATTNKSYPSAPVSRLFLFGMKQDLVFQQEVRNSPRRRHHVRFWKTPPKWWLPGGYKADWLGAASYDRAVGLSSITLQLTHKIERDIDVERDFVVSTLLGAGRVRHVEPVEHYASGFRSRNGGGDHISTDGNLPFVELN